MCRHGHMMCVCVLGNWGSQIFRLNWANMSRINRNLRHFLLNPNSSIRAEHIPAEEDWVLHGEDQDNPNPGKRT